MNTPLLAFGFIFGANVAATAVLMVHDTNNIRTLKKQHQEIKALKAWKEFIVPVLERERAEGK